MKITENITRYDDFKYVLQDVGSLYLGAGFSYQELLGHEMVPFKLRAVLTQYVFKEADPETTLESQFYYLEQGGFLYEVFTQLKIQVKVQVQEQKRKKLVYQERTYSLEELTKISLARKKACGMMIREIIISKLGLMTFHI